MSVLAHIVLRGTSHATDATRALAYILRQSPNVARALVGVLRPAGIDYEPGRIEAELEQENGCPDLTIKDTGGRVRVFVELKFWPGLTPSQPVSYLKGLAQDPNQRSALLFIVPEKRVSILWTDLKERCNLEALNLTDESGASHVTWARVESSALLITSWKYILCVLQGAAHTGEYDETERDISQLHGLVDQIDSDVFLPFRADEPTDQSLARRLIGYLDLIDPIVDQFNRYGGVSFAVSNLSNSYYETGYYLRISDRLELWLGVHLQKWRDSGTTPLWLWIKQTDFLRANGRWSTLQTRLSKLEGLRDYVPDRYGLFIPIRLKTGVEQDRVVVDAVSQTTRIADTLLNAFPAR